MQMIYAVISVVGVCVSQEATQPMSSEELLNTYAVACKNLQRTYSQVQGSGTKSNQPGRAATTILFRCDGPARKAEFSFPTIAPNQSPTPVWVTCFSSENRGFGLARRSNEPRYSVSWIEADEQNKYLFMQSFTKFLSSTYSIYGIPIIDFFTNETVRNLSATSKSDKVGNRVVEVTFHNGPTAKPKSNVITLLPDAGWALRSYRSVVEGNPPQNPTTVEVEYVEPLTTPPVPRLVRYTDANLIPEVFRFDEFTFGPTPAAEFEMSYYQLPDLTVPAVPRSNHLTWWLVGAVVLLVVLAYSFRRWHLSRLVYKP